MSNIINCLVLFILIQFSLSTPSQAQIVSKDSVSFSEDFTTTTLFLEFNRALSQDTVYSSGLPFTFVFMAPLDSISIESVRKNEENTAYTIEFNTRPNTYYSLLSLDVKLKGRFAAYPDVEWSTFSTHFTTGPNALVDSISIMEYSGLITKTSIKNEEILYQLVYTAVLIKPKSFLAFTENHADSVIYESTFNLQDTNLQSGIVGFKSFHFADTSMNVNNDLIYHQIYLDINSTYKDSVVLISFFSGRDNRSSTRRDKLTTPLSFSYYYEIGLEENGSYFSYDPSESNFDFSLLIKPFKWWDNKKLESLPFVDLSVENNLLPKPVFFTLDSAYPNPFNPSTTLSFSVNEPSRISFSVFDVLGRKVQEMNTIEKQFSAGNHQQQFDFSRLASGMYVIEANGVSLSSGLVSKQTMKVSLIK